jgi:hypothetical protein
MIRVFGDQDLGHRGFSWQTTLDQPARGSAIEQTMLTVVTQK